MRLIVYANKEIFRDCEIEASYFKFNTLIYHRDYFSSEPVEVHEQTIT